MCSEPILPAELMPTSQRFLHVAFRLVLAFGLVCLLGSCTITYQPGGGRQFRQRIDDGIGEDPDIELIIGSYRSQLSSRMDSVIAEGARRLTLGKPESTLGNLLADALLAESRASFGEEVILAIINQGGIRLDNMPQGSLSQGYFFELLPFENQVVAVTLDSIGMRQLFEKIARVGGWPISGTCRLTLSDTTLLSMEIQGAPLSNKRTYTVVMPDYIANGGDECAFLRSYPRRSKGELLRDMIIRHGRSAYEKGNALDSKTDGRITQTVTR